MRWGNKKDEAAPGETIRQFYTTLLESFGPQGWWPARTRWEVICGAILTQNTTWNNAALAVKNLRKARLLSARALCQISLRELEALVRPAGFYRQKARTLQNLALWIQQAHRGSLDSLFTQGREAARTQLLALRGIGPETADAILLYAGKLPTFVADAYTRRVLSRHGLVPPEVNYLTAQNYLHQHLPPDHETFNEFHALLVETAKRYCRRNVAHCEDCPLGKFLDRNSKFENRKPAGALDVNTSQAPVLVEG